MAVAYLREDSCDSNIHVYIKEIQADSIFRFFSTKGKDKERKKEKMERLHFLPYVYL